MVLEIVQIGFQIISKPVKAISVFRNNDKTHRCQARTCCVQPLIVINIHINVWWICTAAHVNVYVNDARIYTVSGL